ncbi:hypothetical protein DAD186_18650 [Dermabacter vaginalis]|uniref:Uncharacterized protein n=1 Tax=Dermabacter vaginalis TaxID=1630135 RepID=A0A1B0ZK69_9MICO|nr:hypothetical protein DAD186_18650 [Dermabacter vaginalis]
MCSFEWGSRAPVYRADPRCVCPFILPHVARDAPRMGPLPRES